MMQLFSALAITISLSALVPAALAFPFLGHGMPQVALPAAGAKGSLPYTLREQNDQVCDAGSRQWTGWRRGSYSVSRLHPTSTQCIQAEIGNSPRGSSRADLRLRMTQSWFG